MGDAKYAQVAVAALNAKVGAAISVSMLEPVPASVPVLLANLLTSKSSRCRAPPRQTAARR